MYVKRFSGSTVSEALAAARRELGEETLLLGIRRTAGSMIASAEVTVAVERPRSVAGPLPAPASEPARETPVAPPSTRTAGWGVAADAVRVEEAGRQRPSERLLAELGGTDRESLRLHDERLHELQARFELLSRRIRKLSEETKTDEPAHPGATHLEMPAAEEIVTALAATGLDHALALRATETALAESRALGVSSLSELSAHLAQSLAAFLAVPRVPSQGRPQVLILVGPAGAGKTTTAAKIAAVRSVVWRKRTVLVAADDYRIGAVDQLREYAELIQVGFERGPDASALSDVRARHRDADLLVVDTPGLSTADTRRLWDLARLIEGVPGAEALLVVPATMRRVDLARTIARFRAIAPPQLVFTKIDETHSYGELLAEAVGSGCPVVWLANGQTIPDDLEEATPHRFAEMVVRAAWARKET